MITRLRIQIISIIMVLAILLFAVLDIFLFRSTRDGLYNQSIETLENALLHPVPKYRIRPGDETSASQAYFVMNISFTGTPTALYYGAFSLESPDVVLEFARQVTSTEDHLGDLPELSLRYAKNKTPVGWRVSCVDIRMEQQILQQLRTSLVLINLGGLVIFFLLAWTIAAITTRPVEQSMRRQQQLIADVSHELKTPLTVILSSVEMLRTSDDPAPGQQEQWEEGIQAEALRMKHMIEEMLLLARGDSRRQVLPQSRVDLSETAESELLRFEPMFFESGRALDWDVAPDLFLTGGEADLRKLISILLENALKYASPRGGVRLSLQPEGCRRLLLTVSSDGAPISAEDLPRLFDRFYRADPARSGSDRGHGLGLAIAKTIVDDHRGEIWAESTDGRNIFSVRLPRTK